MHASTATQGTSERQTTIPTPKRFISDVEVEALYGLRRKTLQNWRLLGRGPVYRKFGKGVRYDVAALEEWIANLPSGGGGIPSSAVRSASR
jgi:hypothetical protein